MCRRIIRGVLLIGFSVQIVLGLSWMLCNMAGVQDFAGVSTGAYVVVERLFGRVYPLVYALQIAAAVFAGMRLVRQLCDCEDHKLLPLWGSLALLTLPMAMQCHLALLPCSFVCSAGLLQLSFCCELFRLGGKIKPGAASKSAEPFKSSGPVGGGETFRLRIFAGVCGCYLVQAALMPEYLLLGALTPAAAFGLAWKGMAGGKIRFRAAMLFAAALAAAAGIGITVYGAEETRAENDISGPEWTLVKRVCWPTIWEDSGRMPDRLWEAVEDVLWESHYYPGNMDSIFKPAVEAAMDAEEAKPLLVELAVSSWDAHYPMVIRQIGWDVLGYFAAPLILQLQLAGDAYESYSGRNYAVMRSRSPVLTRHYVDYGCWWFGATVCLTVVLLAARLAAGEKPYGGREARLFLTALLGAGACVFRYTVQSAGIMDYKRTVLVYELWLLWSLRTFAVCAGTGRRGGENSKGTD